MANSCKGGMANSHNGTIRTIRKVFAYISYYLYATKAHNLAWSCVWNACRLRTTTMKKTAPHYHAKHSRFASHRSPRLTCLKLRKGTNWTMSRRTGSPLGERRIPSSPSSICMSLKSALPTPTMMTDMGRWEAWTMAFLVSAMSVITPSVKMSRMKYCYRDRVRGRGSSVICNKRLDLSGFLNRADK